MSDESPPFDRIEKKLVWRDGFDVQTARNKQPLRGRELVWLVSVLVIHVFVTMLDLSLGYRLLIPGFVMTVGLLSLLGSRRRWRLRGNSRQLTISKTLGMLGWGRRDFMWGEIRGFGICVGANGFADVMVTTRYDTHSLNFELTPEDAEQLAGALTKMRIRAKMDVLAQTGYRAARLAAARLKNEKSVELKSDRHEVGINGDTND